MNGLSLIPTSGSHRREATLGLRGTVLADSILFYYLMVYGHRLRRNRSVGVPFVTYYGHRLRRNRSVGVPFVTYDRIAEYTKRRGYRSMSEALSSLMAEVQPTIPGQVNYQPLRRKYDPSEFLERILVVLHAHPNGASTSAILRESGISKDTLRKYLSILVERGEIELISTDQAVYGLGAKTYRLV